MRFILSKFILIFLISFNGYAQVAIETNDFEYIDDFTGFLGTADPNNWVSFDIINTSNWQGTDNGSSNTGGKYSYGVTIGGVFDGSLGFLPSATRVIAYEIDFENETGETIEDVLISYTAEHWRNIPNGRTNGWEVSFFINGGSQQNLNDLTHNFQPRSGDPIGAPPGNSPWESVEKSEIVNANLEDGDILTIRFVGNNGIGGGARQGVAIDDFSLELLTLDIPQPQLSLASGTYFTDTTVFVSNFSDYDPSVTLYFTLDGTDPDENSNAYNNISGIFLEDGNGSIQLRIIAIDNQDNESPVVSGNYTFPINISSIENLRQQPTGSIIYRLTSQPVFSGGTSFRNTKFFQDYSGFGIQIDDAPNGLFNPGVINTEYNIGDQVEEIIGTLGIFQNQLQFVPLFDPGKPISLDNVINPVIRTISNLSSDDQSRLVTILNADFESGNGVNTFAGGGTYEDIADPSISGFNGTFKNVFGDSDITGSIIPDFRVNVSGIIQEDNNGIHIASRGQFDLTAVPIGNFLMNPDSIRVNEGEEFEIIVEAELINALASGIEIHLEFDTEFLEVINTEPVDWGTGQSQSVLFNDFNNAEGSIDYAVFQLFEPWPENETFGVLSITFRTLQKTEGTEIFHLLNVNFPSAISFEGQGILENAQSAFVSIDDCDSFIADFSIQNTSCPGLNDGVVNIEISGGTPPYSILWDDGDTSSFRNDLSSRLYQVSIFDSGICEIEEFIFVGETTDTIAPDISCPVDGEIILTNSIGVCGYEIMDGEFDAIAEDNCVVADLVNNFNGSSTLNGVIVPIGSTTITWTATDASDNSTNCEFTLIVSDVEDPVFLNCPGDTLIFNTAGSDCEGNIVFSIPVAADNCEVEVNHVSGPQPGDALELGVHTVVYEAVDSAGNSTLCEFDIEVVDQLDPIAVCTDIDIYLDENGEVSITADDVDGGSSDNCTDPGDLELSIDQSEFTCADLGNNFVTLTVTDSDERESICVATVQVLDTIAPTFTCPVDRAISECLGQLPDLRTEIEDLADNCGTDDVSLTQNPAPGTVLPGSAGDVLIVTITATDASGNSTSCEVEVEILDEDEPFFQNCPLYTVTVGNDVNQCGAFVNWSQPVAFDNCDIELNVTQISGPNPGTFLAVGDTVLVVYEAIDLSGNSITCTFNVVVVDTEAPRFVTTLPLDEIVPCDAIPAPFVIIPEWHTVDNCTESADIEVVYEEEIIDEICPHTYTIKRKWTIIDEAGNSAFHVQKVYVVDDVAPTFTVPADVTISCDASTDPSNTGEPTDLDDNCSEVEDLIVEFSDESTQGSNPEFCDYYEYVITRTWTVTDECDNVNTQIQIITVQDNNPPMAECQDITVELDENGVVIISANDINNGSTDNCAAEEFLTLELDKNMFTCDDLGENTVILSVIDPCGNVGICMAIVTVEDNILPTLECPADIVINLGPGECGAFVSFAPAVLEDNCAVSWTSEPANGSLFEIGITVVTITATDEGGNEVTCEFTVEIIENTVTNFTLVCNNLLNVSLGPDCEAEINADMILEGNNHFCYDNYEIIISTEMGGDPIPTNPVVTQDYVGDTLVVTIIDPNTGNSCWSLIYIEDKLAPVVDCPEDITVSCVAHTDTDITGEPELLSCETSVTINFTDIVTVNSKCSPERARIIRNWTITDESGNSTVCSQRISIEVFDLFAVTFPEHFDDFDQPSFNCRDVAVNPSLTSPENTGRPMIDGKEINEDEIPFCDLAIGYQDIVLNGCGGSYSIIRSWYLTSLCLPVIQGINPVVYFQRINVWDMDAPVFVEMDDIVVSTRANSCYGDWIIEAPGFEDDCSNISWYISSSAGFITVDPISGIAVLRDIPLGTHTIRYIASDACGYYATKDVSITVVDDVPPIAICDLTTRVSLGTNGFALVNVSAWDDGSYDNCGIMDITARRKVDHFACNNSGAWEESLLFCCEDADINGIGVVEVEVRVRDYAGNENYCWVNVEVEDKLRPQLTCPADVTVNCAFDLDLDNLEVFGRIAQPQIGEDIRVLVIDPVDLAVPAQIPVQTITDGFVVDNCGIESITETNVFTLNPQCGNVGTDPNPLFPFRAIQRRFAVVDQFGNSANCQQDIYIRNNTVPFNGDDIEWPRDITLMECGTSSDDFAPSNLGQFGVPVRDRQPSWNTISCSKPAVSYQDQVFTLVDSACFKILRSWKVIDWCNHNPNTGQGEWTHVQVIYIQDTQAPVCNNCVDQVFVDESSSDCTGFAELVPDITDCTPTDMLVASWQIDAFQTGTFDISGSGLDASGNYPFGTHTIRWTVYDLCSNTAVFEYDFEVVDGKLPTPVCLNGVATVVMPISGCIELEASTYDAGSFDNCTESEDLIFSWSSDPEDTVMEFCCDDLGTNVVEIWVTDEAGNQDFCITYIQIQDPNEACGNQSIAGLLTDESGDEVEGVTVELESMLNGDLQSFLSGNNGFYLFNNLQLGEDYTVRPSLDEDPLNGVTTYDIALIQRHILGIQYLDSPYKLIAADVRPDGVINVLDIADLRSLILGRTSNFAQNTSWRFVSTAQQFAAGLIQPPVDVEENRLYEDFNSSVRDADFVGVKIGDVNASAQPNSLTPSMERRTGEVIALQIEEGMYRAGEQMSVEINAANFHEVVGYQFTFEFDNSRLDFAGFESGVIEVTDNNFGFHMTSEGVITTSWNSMKAENISDNEVLFVLNFSVKSDIRATDAFRLSDRITKTEAYRMGGEVLDLDLIFTRDGQAITTDVFALYQNQPNPFNGQTIIGFVLPTDMDAEMSIFDVTGRLIHVISGEYAAGYNEIRLQENDLPASGVYYYQLEAEGYSATKRMVLTGN